MLDRVRKLVAPPVFADEEKTRVAAVLNTIIVTMFAAMVAVQVLHVLSSMGEEGAVPEFATFDLASVTLAVLFFLVRRGHTQIASVGISLLFAGVVTFFITQTGISLGNNAVFGYSVPIVAAGLLLSGRAAVIFTLLSAAILWGIAYIETGSSLNATFEAALPVMTFVTLGMIVRLTANSLHDALERTRRSNRELASLRSSLEERVAERTADLEWSNQELERFAYVAAHHLQEPLRMVISYAQLLDRRYRGKLGVDADEFISYVVDGARRMRDLVRDLLAYSELDARGTDLAPTRCETVLERVLSSLQGVIEESDATVTHDPLPTVVADAAQLGLVFQNLVENAIKFRGEKAPRVHVSAEQRDSEWVFSVRDNSIGIDPEQVKRIFEIFQRPHNWKEYPGTGFGLAACKKIVERHGGRIWVESEPGEGSTFHFTIPDKGGNVS